jgi:erythromycin esterase
VVDDKGSPVRDARVAAIPAATASPYSNAHPLAAARTDASGAFTLKDMSPGTYTIGATAPGVGTGHANLTIGTDGAATMEPLALAGGATLSGRVRDAAGAPWPGARVGLFRPNPGTGALMAAYTEADAEGRYTFTLPPGDYVVLPAADGALAEGASVSLKDAGQLDVTLARQTATTTEALAALLRPTSAPLRTSEPDGPDDDLRAALGPLLAGARVVALGEGSHGARELFRAKHRIYRHIVETHGPTALAFESNAAATTGLDDFVLGVGDAPPLAKTGYFSLVTEEVRDLLIWMRAYNQDPKHRHKLRVVGIDMQDEQGSISAALEFLSAVDPARADALRPRLAAAGEPTPDSLAARRAAVDELLATLEREAPRYRKKGGELGLARAKQAAIAAQQGLALVSQMVQPDPALSGVNLRDRAMADNVQAALLAEGAKGRVVVWAHNIHVMATPLLGERTLGTELRERHGDAFVAVGLHFGRGSMLAVDIRVPEEQMQLGTVSVGPAPPGYLEAALAALGHPTAAVRLRGATGLDTLLPTRTVGAAFAGESEMQLVTAIARAYDAIVYVDEITAARPLR